MFLDLVKLIKLWPVHQSGVFVGDVDEESGSEKSFTVQHSGDFQRRSRRRHLDETLKQTNERNVEVSSSRCSRIICFPVIFSNLLLTANQEVAHRRSNAFDQSDELGVGVETWRQFFEENDSGGRRLKTETNINDESEQQHEKVLSGWDEPWVQLQFLKTRKQHACHSGSLRSKETCSRTQLCFQLICQNLSHRNVLLLPVHPEWCSSPGPQGSLVPPEHENTTT